MRDLIPEIHIPRLLEDLGLEFGGDLIKHLFEFVVFQRRIVHPMQFAIDPEHRLVARGKVEIRGLLLEHQVEECIDLRHKFRYGRIQP